MEDRKLNEPIGYTYQADNYCDVCMMATLIRTQKTVASLVFATTETCWEWLQGIAPSFGINIEDESSYDSGDFPKPIWAWLVTSSDYCNLCREPLVDVEQSSGRWLP